MCVRNREEIQWEEKQKYIRLPTRTLLVAFSKYLADKIRPLSPTVAATDDFAIPVFSLEDMEDDDDDAEEEEEREEAEVAIDCCKDIVKKRLP
jgi:hypothetical protein